MAGRNDGESASILMAIGGVVNPHQAMNKAHYSGLDEAGNGTRTRDILLGKQTLYQLSYTRIYANYRMLGSVCQAAS